MKKSNLLILMLTTISFNLWASEPSGSPKANATPPVPRLNFESAASTVSPTGVALSESSIASHRRTAAPSPAPSDASDTKQAAEKNHDEASKSRGEFVARAFDIALAMDQQEGNHKTVALLSMLASKTLFGLNPHVLTSPQVRHIPRPHPASKEAQEELATNNHQRRLLEAISNIPQADGTLDISPVERQVILHFLQSISSHDSKAVAEGNNTATASLRLDPQNAELQRIRAELREELTPVIAEELRGTLTRTALSKKLKPKVKADLRTELTPVVKKELAAELRAKQKRTDYWGYAACVGVGCAIGGFGYWAYNAMTGTKSNKTPSK